MTLGPPNRHFKGFTTDRGTDKVLTTDFLKINIKNA